MKKMLILLFAVCLLVTLPQAPVQGASLEFTDSVKDQLNLALENAGNVRKNTMVRAYDSLAGLQQEHKLWEGKNAELHNANEARLSAAKKQIKEIDAGKVRELEQKVSSVKQKYQPLFDSSSLLNKRVSSAKKLKDKTLYKLLQAQADGLKTACTIARQEIRMYEAELKSAKEARTRRSADIRKVLGEADSWKAKIKTEKSSISAANKSSSTEWSNFKAALKKKDSDRIASILTRLETLFSQGLKHRKNIYTYESKITDILIRAEGKMK